MIYDLKELRACANKIASECDQHKEKFPFAAVVWGNFRCICAELYVVDDGEGGYRVYCSDADPCNRELSYFIRGRLAEEGFADVEVMLEW